jgi:hypothetical protein
MSLTALLIWLFSVMTVGPQGSALQCHPVVENVRFDGQPSSEVSRRLSVLEGEDQAIRQPANDVDVAEAIKADRLRREEAMGYLQNGQVIRGRSLYSAALLFQHGDCPDHYQLAADLALRAHKLFNPNGAWLYTAATDRYLLSVGQVQRYGTQYVIDAENHFVLCPVSPATTDDERAQFGLPGLAELEARAAEFDEDWIVDAEPISPLVRIAFIKNMINDILIPWRCIA